MTPIRHTAAPLRWWFRRLTFAILAGLLIGLGIDVARGGVTALWLRYAGVAAYLGQGERIAIRPGHELYLDCRGTGSPTLILEAGMGSDSTTWVAVHDDLARITRTCSYDRTGRGRSDGGSASDLVGMSGELSALLAAGGESPPYVVVGHSLGSVIGRVHASLQPADVVGLVLVDGFDPDIFDARVLPLLGPIREGYVGQTDGLWSLVGSVESIDVERSKTQLAAADVGAIPIEAIIAPRIDARLDTNTNDAIQAAIEAGYNDLSTGAVTLTRAWGSSHMVQFDQPTVVIEAVLRIVADLRG